MKLIIILLILFFTSCSKKVKVETISIIQSYVESTVSTINSGTVEAKKQSTLSFGTIGRISKVHSSIGNIVAEGTVIAELENADLRAIFDEARKEYGRAIELFNNGLVSISHLDAAKKASEVARVNLEKTMIKAPFKGMITALDLKIGEFYQNQATVSSKPIVQIIDLERRIVKGEIDEVDLSKIKNNQTARVKLPALKNRVFNAIVKKVVPFVSTAKDQDRTSEIELELITNSIEESIQIPVGASADVEIIVDKKENTLVAPSNFVHGVGNKKYVYAILNNRLTKKDVTIGVGNYDRSEILTGLKVNDLIARPPEGADDISKLKVEAEVKKWP